MFKNLVESGSHQEDLRRKGSFFLGTLVFYVVLMLVTGVISIYAYNAHLDHQNLELVTLVAPVPPPPEIQPTRHNEPRPTTNSNGVRQMPMRINLYEDTRTSILVPKEVSAIGNRVPPVPRGGAILGHTNSDPDLTGPVGPHGPGSIADIGPGGNRSIVKIDNDEPPPPPPKPTPAPVKKIISISKVLNSQAISKPAPPYPQIAKAAHASGLVTVQILIDETGRVISAHATSGHLLLQDAAVKAAYQARFSPTLLNGQPIKVSGVITYNFVLQ